MAKIKMIQCLVNRYVYMVIVVFSTVFVNGLIFGWAPLLLALRDSGYFSAFCENGEVNCDAANVKLTTCFTCGIIAAQLAGVVIGPFMDYFGPRLARMFSATIYTIACLIIGFAGLSSPSLYVGFAALSLGGGGVHITNFHISSLFPGYESTVVSIISGLFAASNYVFLLFKIGYYNYGLAVPTMFKAWSITGGIVFITAVTFPDKQFQSLKDWKRMKDPVVEIVETTSLLTDAEKAENEENDENDEKKMDKDAREDESKRLSINLTNGTFLQQVLTPEYIGLLCFYGFWVMAAGFYIASVTDQLAQIGDTGFYVGLYAIISPLGFIATPFVGRLQDLVNGPTCIALVLTANIIWQSFLLIPNLKLQAFVVALWTCSTNSVFATFFAQISRTFGFKYYGILVGMSTGFAAVLNICVTPLYQLSETQLNHNYVPCNTAFVIVGGLLYAFPLTMYFRLRRWRNEKRKLEVN